MESMLNSVDVQIHRLDAIQLGAIAVGATIAIALLLVIALIVAWRSFRHLSELRDLERDGYVRHHDVLQAILRQVSSCASDAAQLRQEMAAYVTSREAQLEERKKILKSIAGHLATPQPRSGDRKSRSAAEN